MVSMKNIVAALLILSLLSGSGAGSGAFFAQAHSRQRIKSMQMSFFIWSTS